MSKKIIEVDDDLYAYIAGQTQHIGESASDILRRLLNVNKPPEAIKSTTSKGLAKATQVPKVHVLDRLSRADLSGQRSVVARFLTILAALHRCHSDHFAKVLDIRGRDRQYFAQSEVALNKAGTSTNPKPIPESDYWVVTNNNTTRKKSMLTQVAETLGYSEADAEKIRDLL